MHTVKVVPILYGKRQPTNHWRLAALLLQANGHACQSTLLNDAGRLIAWRLGIG
jgi:hypothetical protein